MLSSGSRRGPRPSSASSGSVVIARTTSALIAPLDTRWRKAVRRWMMCGMRRMILPVLGLTLACGGVAAGHQLTSTDGNDVSGKFDIKTLKTYPHEVELHVRDHAVRRRRRRRLHDSESDAAAVRDVRPADPGWPEGQQGLRPAGAASLRGHLSEAATRLHGRRRRRQADREALHPPGRHQGQPDDDRGQPQRTDDQARRAQVEAAEGEDDPAACAHAILGHGVVRNRVLDSKATNRQQHSG